MCDANQALDTKKMEALDVSMMKDIAEIELMKLRAETLRPEVAEENAKAIRRREIMFICPVEDITVAGAIRDLHAISAAHPGEDITINIMSPGGDVPAGLALYDFIQQLKVRGHKIITHNLGFTASMGVVLLQAGTVRTANPNSTILVHEVSGATGGTLSQIQDNAKYLEMWQDKCLDILDERTSVTLRTIKKNWTRRDWVMDAQEALKKGFIDAVVGQED